MKNGWSESDPKGAQVYLCVHILVFYLLLSLFVALDPIQVLYVEIAVCHEKLNKRMVEQVDCAPSLIRVLLQAARYKVSALDRHERGAGQTRGWTLHQVIVEVDGPVCLRVGVLASDHLVNDDTK